MKKSFAILLIVMLLAVTGCQKTPETPIVVGKNQEEMIEKAEQPLPTEKQELPLTERYETKEHLKKTITEMDGKLIIEVDAEVSVPDAEEMPIVKITPANFSQEEIYSMIESLCGETPMYKGRSVYAKKEIAESLVMLNRELETAGDPDEVLAMIAEYEAEYETAPETIEDERSDGTLRENREELGDGTFLGTYTSAFGVEFPNKPYGYRGKQYSVFNNSNQTEAIEYEDLNGKKQKRFPDYQASFEFCEEQRYLAASGDYWEAERRVITGADDMTAEELQKIVITPEEAIKKAEMFFAENGISAAVDHVLFVDAEAPFYEINCTRTVNGANLTFGGEGTGGDGYAPYWVYERMQFWVSQDGLIYFVWRSPYEINEAVVENASLMSFSDIEDIFYKMMTTIYGPAAKTEDQTVINVSRVNLRLQRIKSQDSYTEGLLIPVWCFYGEKQVDESVENPGMVADWERGYVPLLTINAVDGSVINPEEGY